MGYTDKKAAILEAGGYGLEIKTILDELNQDGPNVYSVMVTNTGEEITVAVQMSAETMRLLGAPTSVEDFMDGYTKTTVAMNGVEFFSLKKEAETA